MPWQLFGYNVKEEVHSSKYFAFLAAPPKTFQYLLIFAGMKQSKTPLTI